LHTIPLLVILRRIILLTILFLPQRFWLGEGWKRASRIPRRWLRTTGRAFIASVVIGIGLILTDRIFYKFIPDSVSPFITSVFQLWVFTSTFAWFCVKAVHLVEWLWSQLMSLRSALTHTPAPDPGRRTFFRYAASFVGVVPFVAGLYGYARERLQFEVVRVAVPIPNLPAALNGLRIVQLSDIHIGDYMPADEIRRAVALANSLTADIAVITGDFVSDADDPLAVCIQELSRLRAPLGVWGCNGNHEIYAGAEDAAEKLFTQNGMTLLRQKAVQLDWKSDSFNLIGVDYQHNLHLTGSSMPTLSGVESLVRQDKFNLLLSHNPNTFSSAAGLGIALTLSGHTHGGQINVEILSHSFSPAKFMTPFVAGLYQLPNAQSANPPAGNPPAFLYVNRGLGTLGVPARIGARPEITLLTLQAAS
jgi:predicted MPP superfamily phosphohydrolase